MTTNFVGRATEGGGPRRRRSHIVGGHVENVRRLVARPAPLGDGALRPEVVARAQ